MLPTVGSDTLKIFIYAAEVAGRTLGVASMPNLVPDAERRATIEKAGNAIATITQQITNAYVARLLAEFVNQRIAVGKGRGVDKGFDAAISVVSETIRTSLADRSTRNPDYLEIFPNGAEAYTSPSIKEERVGIAKAFARVKPLMGAPGEGDRRTHAPTAPWFA